MKLFKENRLIHKEGEKMLASLESARQDLNDKRTPKIEKPETPKIPTEKELTNIKEENNREAKRIKEKSNDLFRNVQNLIPGEQMNLVQSEIDAFNEAIESEDYELAKGYMETISDLLDFAPEDTKSYTRACEKIKSARDVGMFDRIGISIYTSEDDPKIPARQFKIIDTEGTATIFGGGVYIDMDTLNSELFLKGIEEKNLETAYLTACNKEIERLFSRSEYQVTAEDKEMITDAINSSKVSSEKPATQASKNTDDSFDDAMDEEAYNQFWAEYQKTQKIPDNELKTEEYTELDPVNNSKYIDRPTTKETKPVQNNITLKPEDPADIILNRRLPLSTITPDPKVESILKAQLTEKYDDVRPISTRSETINAHLAKLMRYYSRSVTKAQVRFTINNLKNKKTDLTIY